jgi:hypothetical protein
MTTPQNEYMKNVKWTTAGIVLTSTISIIITIIWFLSGIKDDIKDTRTSSKEQMTAVRKTIDSVQTINNTKFQSIEDELQYLEVTKPNKRSPSRYLTEKFTVDSAGNRVYRFIPHK